MRILKSVSLVLILGLCLLSLRAAAADKDVDQRVEALLSRMTLTEKVGQMIQVNSSGGKISDELRQRLKEGRVGSMLNESVPETSLEIQRIAVQESRLGIPLIMGRDVIHGFRTIFPIPLGQAAAWDPELVRLCARVAAAEARPAGFQWTFAPMMDVTREPRWGRVAEGFGEDPYLASALAVAMVRGFQGNDLSSLQSIAACAKHFAGYGAVEGGRDYDTANIPEGLLRDVYLPSFKAASEAGVATFMSSFNEINGVPSSGNAYLLRHILRQEWGFKGFVVSDWQSMSEMIAHGFCADLKAVALKSIRAGVDMEMVSNAYRDYLEELVKSGAVAEELVNESVRDILRIKFMLGLFDGPQAYAARTSAKPTPEALALAKRAALESAVLLKNQGQTLPLSKSTKFVAVIGPLADEPYEVLGTWNRDGQREDTVTPLAAIRALLGDSSRVHYAQGLAFSRSRETNGFAQAIEAARSSEVALLFVGEEALLSGEAHSRAHLDLPGAQNALIEAVAATGKPLVLVVLSGRPLCIGDMIAKSQATLYGWHPGTMGGPALADLLFGVESPSGKLTITFPLTEGQIPIYYAHKNTGRPPTSRKLRQMDEVEVGARQSSLGDVSRYIDIGYAPQYPFGYGLSYTHFKYANLRLSSPQLKTDQTLKVSVDLTNSGSVEADEITQLYVRDLVASITRPVKELKGFQRIRLKPQETRQLAFDVPIQSLGFHNAEMKYVVEPGKFQVWVGGNSESGPGAEFEVTE